MSVNKIILLGNLGKDPEVREFENGKIVSFTLATTDKAYTNKQGQQVPEKTEWHNCVCFGHTADFVANFTYMLDFDVYNATAYALSSNSGNQNTFWNVYSKFADNRWRYTAPNGYVYNDVDLSGECLYKNTYIDYAATTYYKALNANTNHWNPADLTTNIMLDAFVEDGSFIRCSDITIGYTLPKNISKKFYVNKVRAYVSASNLFILTKYSGYDPEVDVQSGLTPSMDYNRYPRARTFSCGLNVTF